MDLDPTEDIRRAMVPEMPKELQRVIEAGGQVWDTEAMREAFEPLGFGAPFMKARRKEDGVVGSLEFTHNPRFYFNFEPLVKPK